MRFLFLFLPMTREFFMFIKVYFSKGLRTVAMLRQRINYSEETKQQENWGSKIFIFGILFKRKSLLKFRPHLRNTRHKVLEDTR